MQNHQALVHPAPAGLVAPGLASAAGAGAAAKGDLATDEPASAPGGAVALAKKG